MRDIQGEFDARGVRIDRVGITGLKYPLRFVDGELTQAGIADLDITVELEHDRRGTHMSRMVELVRDHLAVLDPRRLPVVLKDAARILDAPAVTIRAGLPFATPVVAPVSGRPAHQVHELTLAGTLDQGSVRVETTVVAEVTSLCPCSKAISDYGAHNQRSRVRLSLVGDGDDPYPLSASAAVEAIRGAGSAAVFPVVKRPDERHLTMLAHDHPVFVEDMVRELSLVCRRRGLRHRVQARNLESIHSHDAVASIDRA